MGLHDPFGYLKHKLWPKEGSGIVVITLCVGGVLHTVGKSLDEGYNFTLNLTSIKGLHTKLWASKIVGVLISKILGLPTWESWTKWHLGASPMVKHREYYKGEGGGFF